jgi:hypothetical protein
MIKIDDESSFVLVEDRKFSHTFLASSPAGGRAGMARITVRLSPLNLEADHAGRDVQVLGIREARA